MKEKTAYQDLAMRPARSCSYRLAHRQISWPVRLIVQVTTNFTENRASKSFFFSEDSKETRSLIFVSVIKKGVSGKHPIRENNMYVFIKGIIGKMNYCYWPLRFFFDLY